MRSNIKLYLGICKLMGVFRNVCVSVLCIARNHTYQHLDSIIHLPWGEVRSRVVKLPHLTYSNSTICIFLFLLI